MLYGRYKTKLERCVEELEAQFLERRLRKFAVDASPFTDSNIDRIAAATDNILLHILVKDVGGTIRVFSPFEDFEDFEDYTCLEPMPFSP